MTTDIAPRTWMDDADQLPAEIPGAAALEPGRMNWYHGVDAGKIKTPGVFFARETAFITIPESPWEADDRYGDKGEMGYAAPRLDLLFIANRSQWFIPGENQGDLPQWIEGYQVGAKKLTEYLVLIRGLDEPMVLSVSGKYKAAPIEKILGDYRRGALTQAMRQHRRTLPAWAFALTLGGRTMQRVKRHPTIGDRVTIGAGAKVLGPVRIGADSAIGANAVVTHDVPAESIATGIPAVVRLRSESQRESGVDPTTYIDPAMYI